MIKNILLLIALITVATLNDLSAQVNIFLGPTAGYNARAIINQNNYGQRRLDYTFTGDVTYGGSIGVDFNNQHIIQIEVLAMNLGQGYDQSFSDFSLQKQVDLSYIHIPLTYRFVTGRKDKDHNKGTNFHILAGAYYGILQDANMSHSIDNSEVSFYDFVTRGGGNPNLAVLNRRLPNQGNPDYNQLFTDSDFGAIIGFGVQSFVTTHFKLSLDLRLGVSLQDINGDRWRFLNRDGDYNASRNLFGALTLSAFYIL